MEEVRVSAVFLIPLTVTVTVGFGDHSSAFHLVFPGFGERIFLIGIEFERQVWCDTNSLNYLSHYF